MGKQHNTVPAYNGNRPYIFISYSHKDASKVVPLISAMQEQGFRVWYDREIEGGNEWSNYVRTHLKNCTVFVVFVSHNSMASKECLEDIDYAKKYGKAAVMVFLGRSFPLHRSVEVQTSHFHRMECKERDGAAAFVAQLREAERVSICCSDDTLEYYKAVKENDAVLYEDLLKIASRKPRILDHIEKFVITRENEELYRQSELIYAGWLFDREEQTKIDTVDKAIELCRLSAEQGNPKALARLAYFYDKNYICVSGDSLEGDEFMHFKIAYNYYTMLCFARTNEIEVHEGCEAVDWNRLREATALAMLRMLRYAPAALSENATYQFKQNLERVQSELGMSDISIS